MILKDQFYKGPKNYYCIRFLASGGWSETEMTMKCHGHCGDASTSYRSICNNPEPSYRYVDGKRHRTGKKCPCNSANATEIFCDGLMKTIDIPCNHILCK